MRSRSCSFTCYGDFPFEIPFFYGSCLTLSVGFVDECGRVERVGVGVGSPREEEDNISALAQRLG